MESHTFLEWLSSEAAAVCCALLKLYEQRDQMAFIDGPRIERDYMQKVGEYEETVIKEEIEAELLKKKKQLVQAAINRREPIDESSIDEEIDRQRRKILKEAAGSEINERKELDADQTNELNSLYREIVQKFHPQVHPDLTETHRMLFQKAQDAYRKRDLPALRLIHDMLISKPEGGITIQLELVYDFMSGDQSSAAERIKADYTLIPEIYENFEHTLEEAAIQEEIEKYRGQTDDIMQEIENMRNNFPFIAEEMLSDPEKTAEYKRQLDRRFETAISAQKRCADEISEMIKGAHNG